MPEADIAAYSITSSAHDEAERFGVNVQRHKGARKNAVQ